MIKHEIFVNKYLSVQTQRNKYHQRIFYMFKLINRDNTSADTFYITIRGRARINFRVLQNFTRKSITIKSIKSKGFYCRLFWPKLHWNEDNMALAWVAKLSKKRAIFKNLLSFYLRSLLHGIVKTFVKSFTRSFTV